MSYSFLMSVYFKENPVFFDLAIKSMLSQTIFPDEIIIVCDGPLTTELDRVIYKYMDNSIFKIVRLKKNYGLGHALNEGIKYCKNDFVLRADSDDISLPTRASKQITQLEKGFDIVGGGVAEFIDNNPNKINCVRMPPENHCEILKFAKKRCPINHPSAAFRKSIIQKAGGYKDLKFMEDYFLWIRCILTGGKFYNIQEPLVKMRAGRSMYQRRGGKAYRKSCNFLFFFMKKNKIINHFEYIRNCILYWFYSHINPSLKSKISAKFLRKKGANN